MERAVNIRDREQCGDYISHEDALACFHDWTDKRGDVHTADEMPEYRALEALPSVDAAPVRHGRWVHCDDGQLSYRCSECGKHAYGSYSEVFTGEYRYCPVCGAKMDGKGVQ